MAIKTAARPKLCRLRRSIAEIEGRLAERMALDSATSAVPLSAGGRRGASRSRQRLKLDVAPLDSLLGGGLPLSTLIEIRARESCDGGAAGGFVMALAARLAAAGRASALVWIGEADARREAGGLYAPGLAAFGLDPSSVIEVVARTEKDALWAFEAALSCRGVAIAVCELRRAALGLSATRRCALRARDAGVTAFLLRLASEAEASAAEIRFALSPAPAGTIGGFAAGVGRMAWHVALEKNRAGPTGDFTLEWNAHERSFVERGGDAYPQYLPAAAADRPPRPFKTARSRRLRRAS